MFRIHMLPAEDGDCFLVETGQLPHRILVDGGRRSTAQKYLKNLLAELSGRPGPLIDLVVLTHIDADHIEGLLALIEDAGDIAVGEVWFNGLDQARFANGEAPPVRRTPPIGVCRRPQPTLSIRQAKDFADALETRGWRWNTSLTSQVAMVEASGALPAVALPNGGRITLLGPPRSKLAAFVNEWEHWFELLGKPTAQVLAAKRPRSTPKPGELEALAHCENSPDTAKPNGTSITFVVEHDNKRAIFCADAHPDDVAAGLTRFGGTGRIRFDAVKVAHHGSAANNTSTLIDRLNSAAWLISSNGLRHRHPEPEAIARIALAPCPNKRLIFNYRTEYNEAWADHDLADHYRFQTQYPTTNRPTVIDLL